MGHSRSMLLEAMRAGRALDDVAVLNCHAHIGRGFSHPAEHLDAASLVRVMDRLGIDRACVSGALAIGPHTPAGNDEVLRALDEFPGRFVGTAVANPHYPDEVLSELARMFAQPGVGMIKVHPEFHASRLDGPGYEPVWEFAAARRIPVLTHTWGEGRGYDHPLQAEHVARRYPSLPLILAHSGGTPAGLEASIEAARRTPNLYLDTATSLVYRGAIERLVREVGARRVLFGTDGTYLADPPQLAKVVYARLSDDDKRAILGRNLAHLLEAADLSRAPS